jgi:hypothetical protein
VCITLNYLLQVVQVAVWRRTRNVSTVVKHLPSICKTLNSIPSTEKKKKVVVQ